MLSMPIRMKNRHVLFLDRYDIFARIEQFFGGSGGGGGECNS